MGTASLPPSHQPRELRRAGQPAGAVTRWPCDLGQLPWASVPPPSESGDSGRHDFRAENMYSQLAV